MKPLVLYHANCLDGFAAAYAAWTKLGDNADYVPCQYGENSFLRALEQQPIEGRQVYVLDFSFSGEDMLFLYDNARTVTWLDHHKTAFESWLGSMPDSGVWSGGGENFHATLNNHKSGAYLAWEYFHPGESVPKFIRHVDDYDRWQFLMPGTKELNKAVWSYTPWTFQDFLKYEGNTEQLIVEGAAILRAHNQNVQSVLHGGTRLCRIMHIKKRLPDSAVTQETSSIVDATGLACNCPSHLTSDVGHELANRSGTFGLCWKQDKNGKIICGLRSNGEYDVSAIAKALGGGGHKNAAGFEIDLATLQGWMI